MKMERAIELVKWGLYAKPPAKNEAERREALRMVLQDKEARKMIGWT